MRKQGEAGPTTYVDVIGLDGSIIAEPSHVRAVHLSNPHGISVKASGSIGMGKHRCREDYAARFGLRSTSRF